MKCIVCSGSMSFYFSKKFNQFNLGEAQYWKCGQCGFVAAKTIYELGKSEWKRINEKFHSQYHFRNECFFDKNWISRLKKQASIIAILKKQGILLQEKPWLDYGCGDGKLSSLLDKQGICLLKYDEYKGKHTAKSLSRRELKKSSFDMVISTSVYEHVRSIKPLEEMQELVGKNGCLAIHTLVREDIPADSQWFYLLPVHCSLFTNKSMKVLFDRWGFEYSIYHIPSRLWFWFKKKPKNVEKIISDLNKKTGDLDFFGKKGFMDFWK